MALTMNDPATWLFMSPLLIFAGYLVIRAITMLGSGGKIKIGSFEIDKGAVNDLTDKIKYLEMKIASQEAELYTLKKMHDEKSAFRMRVGKMAKRLINDLDNRIKQAFLDKHVPENHVGLLEEYLSLVKSIELLRHEIVRRALDDWDNNGFHKIGLDPHGNPDTRELIKYLEAKKRDYRHDMKNHLLGIGVQTFTVVTKDGKTTIQKNISILKQPDIELIMESVQEEFGESIISLYNDVIAGSKLRHEKARLIRAGKQHF